MRARRRWRLVYGIVIAVTVVIGLGSRSGVSMPGWLREHGGDVASATCIFFGIRFWRWRSPILRSATFAFSLCVLIELQQLYQAPWAVHARNNRLVGTLLGHGFLWFDIVRYGVGVIIGCAVAKPVERIASRWAAIPDVVS